MLQEIIQKLRILVSNLKIHSAKFEREACTLIASCPAQKHAEFAKELEIWLADEERHYENQVNCVRGLFFDLRQSEAPPLEPPGCAATVSPWSFVSRDRISRVERILSLVNASA